MKVSDEIDSLLRMYSGRKLISVNDIIEFSMAWTAVKELGVSFKKQEKDNE